jgi:hypothetical protein
MSAQSSVGVSGGFGSVSSNGYNGRTWFAGGGYNRNKVVKYKLQYIHGFIIPHSDKVKPLIDKQTNGAEIAVEFPKYGGKPWHFYYAFPTVGLGVMYLDLGNRQMLGSAVSLYPYMNIPVFQTKEEFFSFNFKFGGGIAYVTKKYDPLGPEDFALNNFAIGSNLNAFLSGGFNTEIRLSKSSHGFFSRLSLTADASVQYISNGSIQKPNAGLSILNIAAGVKYCPYLSAIPMRGGLSRLTRKWSLEPVIGIGINEQDKSDPHKYLNASLSVGGYRPLTNAYRLGVNVDLFYNAAFTPARTLPDYYAGIDGRIRAGLSLANEFMFGDFATGVHVGAYVVNKLSHDGFMYLKLVAKYRIWQGLFINIAAKSHLKGVENLEIGFGYSFQKQEKAPYSWMPEKPKKEKKEKEPRTPRTKSRIM